MLRKAFVFFLITFEMLSAATLHTAVYVLNIIVIRRVAAFKHHKILAVSNYLRINGIKGASAKRQIIHSIKNICLAHTVTADKAIQFRREVERRCAYVLKIYYRKFIQYHEISIFLMQSYSF